VYVNYYKCKDLLTHTVKVSINVRSFNCIVKSSSVSVYTPNDYTLLLLFAYISFRSLLQLNFQCPSPHNILNFCVHYFGVHEPFKSVVMSH
jgi:hypothetical protein